MLPWYIVKNKNFYPYTCPSNPNHIIDKNRWIILSGFDIKSTPNSYVCIFSHAQNIVFPVTLNKLQLSFMLSITVYWKFAVYNNILIRKFLLNNSTVLLIFCLQIFCLGIYCDFIFLIVIVLHSGNASYIDRRNFPHLVSSNVCPTSLRMGENIISNSVPFEFLFHHLSHHHIKLQLQHLHVTYGKTLREQFIMFRLI